MDFKLDKKIIFFIEAAVVLIVVAIALFSSMYTVNEQEQAVITQFGKAVGESGAGLHFKIPFAQEAHRVDMTTRGMELGYTSAGGQDYNVESESFMITKDFNFVTIDFYIEWKVSNATNFLFRSDDPEALLRNILQSEARSIVSGFDVDEVLTTAKPLIQSRMKEAAVAKLDYYDLGISLLNISIQDAQPPTDYVISAFKNVENAKQGSDTEINLANTYYNQVIPQARADADKIVKDAEAIKESRINEAIGQVARFNEMYNEYVNNKEITKLRIYLETMEQVLPGIKVYIQNPEQGDPLKILDLTDAAEGGGIIE